MKEKVIVGMTIRRKEKVRGTDETGWKNWTVVAIPSHRRFFVAEHRVDSVGLFGCPINYTYRTCFRMKE